MGTLCDMLHRGIMQLVLTSSGSGPSTARPVLRQHPVDSKQSRMETQPHRFLLGRPGLWRLGTRKLGPNLQGGYMQIAFELWRSPLVPDDP